MRQGSRHLGIKASSQPLAASRSTLHGNVSIPFDRDGLRPVECSHRAFTLTELMVAVAVLIVVIIATSKIFGTASRITRVGQATTSMMTEAATIERMLRDDISKLTTEGFFAIRCVAVRNDYYRAPLPPHVADPNASLLNPNLPADAIIRADQLVFFANAVNSMQTFRPSADAIVRAQGVASRVYWGHAFQLRNASPAFLAGFTGSGTPNRLHAHDPNVNVTPWHRSVNGLTNISMATNLFGSFSGAGTTGAGTNMFGPTTPTAGPNSINGTQPDPRQWLLSRQAVILIDDDETPRFQNSKTVVFTDHVTARSIFLQNTTGIAPWGYSRELRNGRLDAASSQLDDIRRWATYNQSSFLPSLTDRRAWRTVPPSLLDQRTIIQGAVYYPRAERRAPGPNRIDQGLTNHVIGSACSSFAIDWTYDDGVGFAVNKAGGQFLGVGVRPDVEHPWFGLDDVTRGVRPYATLPPPGPSNPPVFAAQTILPINTFPNNIESETSNTATFKDYWAVFGYNQTVPFDDQPLLPSGASNPNFDLPWSTTSPVQVAYTPFPSAIRVTMTLHDPEGKLEGGREVQFVIRLPRRLN